MKQKIDNSRLSRVRLIIGVILAVGGFFTLTVVNSLFAYDSIVTWCIGLGLLIGGLLAAGSSSLISSLSDMVK